MTAKIKNHRSEFFYPIHSLSHRLIWMAIHGNGSGNVLIACARLVWFKTLSMYGAFAMFSIVVSRFQFATSKYYISQFQNTIVSSHISACTTANFGRWTSANVQFSRKSFLNILFFALPYAIHGSIQFFGHAKPAGVLYALCIECFSKFCGRSRKVQLNKFHWAETVFLENLIHFMNDARSLRNRPASSGNIHMNTSVCLTHPRIVFTSFSVCCNFRWNRRRRLDNNSTHENNRNA